MTTIELPELTEREREVLQAVMEHYIATAEPVGSRTLTKRKRIEVSAATVRNTMADLEELGLLSAPHASAGRVPTKLAFRVYVERLADRGRISTRERELIDAITREGGEPQLESILRDAGRVLSTVSNHAALVLMPSFDDVVFSHIELIAVRANAVLAVFVARSGLIDQRLMEIDFPVDTDELKRMSNYLRELLDGRTLSEIRSAILHQMADERVRADEMMRRALQLGERALRQRDDPNVVMEGERTFLDQPEFKDVGKLRKLLRSFEEKSVLLNLLESATAHRIQAQAAELQNTSVLLGSESAVREFKELAAVTASYGNQDGSEGVVGVVGPTRMDYSRVIPLVELTASQISRSLNPEPKQRLKDEPDGESDA